MAESGFDDNVLTETEALGVSERRSRSRRHWRCALGIMVAIAPFAEIFQPGLAWILFVGPHKNPITTTHFEVLIPHDWDMLGTPEVFLEKYNWEQI